MTAQHTVRGIEALEGRTGDIARTVEREIMAVAPYAELGLALGVPTWSHYERVVSLIPFPEKCNLHFWDGDTLEDRFPGILRPTQASPMRYLPLTSMLDVDDSVRTVLEGAFALKIESFAAAEAR